METIVTAAVIGLLVLNMVMLMAVIHRQRTGKSNSPTSRPTGPVVPQPKLELDAAKLQQLAETQFEAAITEATSTFKGDVQGASARLKELIVRLTTEVVEKEMETYRSELNDARKSTIASMQSMQAAVEAKQKELEGGVEAALAGRQKELADRLDTKLGSAVVAYIVESLGMNADLGAQRGFLLENMEQHKQELKQEIVDGNITR